MTKMFFIYGYILLNVENFKEKLDIIPFQLLVQWHLS